MIADISRLTLFSVIVAGALLTALLTCAVATLGRTGGPRLDTAPREADPAHGPGRDASAEARRAA